MHSTSRPRRVRASLLGVALGAALGATAGWSVAAALQVDDEGAGYGGTANALQVAVVGEQVHVSGVGFLAASPVEVNVGDLTATVTADEFGRIDSTLVADGDGASVSAAGTASDGSPRSLQPIARTSGGHSLATLLGGGLGATPVVLSRRKYVRAR